MVDLKETQLLQSVVAVAIEQSSIPFQIKPLRHEVLLPLGILVVIKATQNSWKEFSNNLIF